MYDKEGRIETNADKAKKEFAELIKEGFEPQEAVDQIIEKYRILLNKPL